MSVVMERCPVCAEAALEPFERHPEGEHELAYVLCRSCGVVAQSPRMTEEELAAFYTAGYRSVVQGTEEATDKDLRIQAGRARHLVRFCRRSLPTVRHHLDIGSSSGALIRAFARHYGCRGIGVEPGEAYRQIAQRNGTETVASLEDLDPRRAPGFDFVSLVHVLEHIPDPVGYLRDVRERWLIPGGRLLLEVPNLFGHRATELSHLWLFERGSLGQVLARAGFRVLHARTHGVPRSPFLRLYLTILAEAVPVGDAIRPPRRTRLVGLRRKAGLWCHDTLTERLPGLTWKPWPEPERGGFLG